MMEQESIPAAVFNVAVHESIFSWLECVMRTHSQVLVDAGADESAVYHCINMFDTAPHADSAILERFARAMREPFGVRCFLFDISQAGEFLRWPDAEAMMAHTLRRWPN